ncbi:sorting nexin-29-like [Nannochloropsis oceanica]
MAHRMESRQSRLSRISSRTDTEIFDDGKGEKRHTIYYMNIEVGRNKYYLRKRYTEFLMLHQRLCEQQYPEIEDFDFPIKVWFNNFSDGVIEYRRTRFEAYLTLLLELVNKYPPLRKEVESFLGVPSVIDPPKKYPKTPVPGRRAIQKPAGLQDDPTDSSSSTASAVAPAAGPIRSSFLARRRSSNYGDDDGAAGLGRDNSPTVVTAGVRVTSPTPVESSTVAAACSYTCTTTILAYLFLYIFIVFLLALAAALEPTHARVSALSILGLSSVASLVVMRAFSTASAHDASKHSKSGEGRGKRV